MRLPHYLDHRPSGFRFRLRVPTDLAPLLGRSFVRRTLRTRDPSCAQFDALRLAALYTAAFAALRRDMTKSLDEILAGLTRGGNRLQDWEMTLPNGATIKADGAADHARALDAIGALKDAGAFRTGPSAPRVVHISWEDMVTRWLEVNKGRPIKTLQKMVGVLNAFRLFKGPCVVGEVTRTDVANFVQKAGGTGSSPRSNMTALRSLFELATAGNFYPQDDPTKGQVKFGEAAQRARKKHGWKPFTLDQLQALYDPANLIHIGRTPARWAAVIGLYTGARVSEVAQLMVTDITPTTLRITEDEPGTSTKNDNSNRVIPLHPTLVALGFLDFVTAQRAAGHTRLFPKWSLEANNGAGNGLTNAFSRLIKRLGFTVTVGTLGFHSLRKNVVQAIQGSKAVSEERRRAYVGHSGEDEAKGESHVHAEVYMRAWNPEELAGCLDALSWPIDFDGLRELLTSNKPRPRKKHVITKKRQATAKKKGEPAPT